MGKYNFVSGGAMAGNAISQFLAEREAQNRQQMLDRLAQEARTEQQRQQRETEGRQREQLDFQKQQEERVADWRKATFDDLANQREYTQVSGAVEGARPDDAPLDADMAAKVLRQGFGSRLKQMPGVLMQGPMESGDESMRAEEVGITPEQTTLRPGSRYLDAEAQRTFMEGQANLTREAANARAGEMLDMRKYIAELGARGDARAAALDARMKELQIGTAEDKRAAEKKETDRAEATRTNDATNAIELLNRLEKHKGLGAATGAYELRGATQPAQSYRALRDSVVAALALPNMSSLKGPASDKDVAFIKAKSTILQNDNISDEDAVQAIKDARAFLQTGLIPKASGGAAPAAGGRQAVIGPDGKTTGTVPAGTPLPPGWRLR